MTPLVSILIPCYNAAPWIAATLESALAQDWPNKEVILVDDGSTDESLSVARGFAAGGVRILEQENQGAAAARNTALRASSGQWLQFLDADDLLAPDKIRRQMSVAMLEGSDVLLSAKWARFVDGPGDARFVPEALCKDAGPLDWVLEKIGGNHMMHPGAWLVPRQLADRAGPWDCRLSLDDDGEYFNRVVLASRAVRYCEKSVSYYRSNLAGSLSGQRSPKACESALLSCRLTAERVIGLEDSPRAHRACAEMFQSLCQDIYPASPQVVRLGEIEVARHGGAFGDFPGGRLTKIVSKLFGWKAAKRLRLLRNSVLSNSASR